VNENETQPAYFDDFEITHKANPQKLTVSSWAEYYAFGKVAKASCSPPSGAGGLAYRYGYQGEFAEKDQETDWNSFELRQYDSEIGRWLSTDPYQQYWSPYVGMGNDPVNQVDPDGGINYPAMMEGLGSFVNNFMNWGMQMEQIPSMLSEIGVAGYFNIEEFYISPVENPRITSVVNPARLHPKLNVVRAHKGVDMVPIGRIANLEPVIAPMDGTITNIQRNLSGAGNVITLMDRFSYEHKFLHLNDTDFPFPGVAKGGYVKKGQTIGRIGQTGGVSSGPHLHHEMRLNGNLINSRLFIPALRIAPGALELLLKPQTVKSKSTKKTKK
jgi:RHS repeat-associated protein